MILYLDTSALVKRYFKEEYSEEVVSRWQQAEEIVTSSVAYAETMASFYRKTREVKLSHGFIGEITELFRADWGSFIRVEVNDELNRYIDMVIRKHPLRGFDAIHLASALVIHERLPEDFLFVCFDNKLALAAHEEGLITFPDLTQ